MREHSITFRVRYPEVDAMGFVHHSRFLQYFEMGRVEMLRAHGCNYSDLERQGVYFVVVKAEIRYRAPAKYDEELTLTTRLNRATHVRYDHAYMLKRGDTLLAEGTTTIACVDRTGQVIQIPEALRE
jgi:acyl-CoA thioester hydrolase